MRFVARHRYALPVIAAALLAPAAAADEYMEVAEQQDTSWVLSDLGARDVGAIYEILRKLGSKKAAVLKRGQMRVDGEIRVHQKQVVAPTRLDGKKKVTDPFALPWIVDCEMFAAFRPFARELHVLAEGAGGGVFASESAGGARIESTTELTFEWMPEDRRLFVHVTYPGEESASQETPVREHPSLHQRGVYGVRASGKIKATSSVATTSGTMGGSTVSTTSDVKAKLVEVVIGGSPYEVDAGHALVQRTGEQADLRRTWFAFDTNFVTEARVFQETVASVAGGECSTSDSRRVRFEWKDLKDLPVFETETKEETRCLATAGREPATIDWRIDPGEQYTHIHGARRRVGERVRFQFAVLPTSKGGKAQTEARGEFVLTSLTTWSLGVTVADAPGISLASKIAGPTQTKIVARETIK